MRGLLISFDGTDSSGKATQTKLLIDRLRSHGFTVGHFETPDYTTATGQKLAALFKGTNGSWDDLSWREQMELLAANRAEHRDEVRDLLSSGAIVVYDRYVPSSLAHMAVSALTPEQIAKDRSNIIAAVTQHEYDTNHMPREDLSIFLDVPPTTAEQLLNDRKQQGVSQDETTDSLQLQQRIYDEYQWLCREHPDHHQRVDCLDGTKLLPPDQIASHVWQALTQKFPHLASSA